MIGKIELEDLTQSQNEALIRLLMLVYRSDNKIELEEQDYFQEICSQMNWKSGTSLENFIAKTIGEVRQKDQAEIISEAIKPLKGYKIVGTLLEHMAASDGDFSEKEKQTIEKIQSQL